MIPLYAGQIPGWVLPGASADLNFANSNYYANGATANLASLLSTTRASTGYAQWADGHYSSFGNNVPRITDQGLLSEQASTNAALWCRDMTNAAWVKVTMTAALTATGIDNTANAASTLTATGGNATILQTLTIASSAETYSVFLKRVSGTGTINITENGGTSWTAVTLTTAWQRFSVEATLANPVIGIQIVTSGDVIAADFHQTEALAFPTSPILTTSGSATRAADVITLTGAALNAFKGNTGAFMASFGGAPYATNSAPALNVGLAFTDTGNSRWALHNVNTSGTQPLMAVGNGTTVNSVSDINVAANTAYKVAVRWSSVSTDLAMSLNGRAAVTGAYQFAGGITSMAIGSNGASGAQINEYVKRLVVWPTLSNSQLASVSQ